MKISIGANIKEGPWGGGNLFFKNLSNYLTENGHEVVYDLHSKDIQVILLTDPRYLSESSAYDYRDIKIYKRFINKNVKVIHRINECDERKNTAGLNSFIIKSSKVADIKVFVSTWLKNLYESQGIETKNNLVILSGSNPIIFNNNNQRMWNRSEPMKIVTHHWGANWNKGFDTYELLDELLNIPQFKKNFTFTYIGNLPKNFSFNNSKHIPPLEGIELSKELQKNDLYITGSLNEPSGNHHIEGSLCGLPVMYIDSGGITEYANEHGIAYSLENIQEKLEEVLLTYEKLYQKMDNYPFTSEKMSMEYEELFNNVITNNLKVSNNYISMFLFKKFLKMKYLFKKLIIND